MPHPPSPLISDGGMPHRMSVMHINFRCWANFNICLQPHSLMNETGAEGMGQGEGVGKRENGEWWGGKGGCVCRPSHGKSRICTKTSNFRSLLVQS